MLTIAVDLDGTLTLEEVNWEDYLMAKPDVVAINKINRLYNEGHKIIIHTARPYGDWKVTTKWLTNHHVRYHCLVMGKLRADLYIDNDSRRINDL